MASRTLGALPSRQPAGAASSRAPTAVIQNWILTPFQDSLFVIAAPLIVLAIALPTFIAFGPVKGTSCILLAHVILTVSHHVPTYIRIYGDVDLFKRFKWSFIFGPMIPLSIAMGVVAYINVHNYPIDNFYYLLIILGLWDPSHFLMQHYGFMRIYDRPNAAPRPLAAPMDLSICATWFAYIMLASGGWLPEILRDLYSRSHLPIIFAFSMGALVLLRQLALGIALITTIVYVGYLVWCRSRGYFVSAAKIALFLITFGVMGFTYTPNPWLLGVAPGWTFKVGFAVLGIVHVTQYLAIVWRYNRSLALRANRARPGLFQRLHAKGGWLIGSLYVLCCVSYGYTLTMVHQNRWLMGTMLAIGFTSTLMHYYFDGFIWKVRHKQNVENLAMEDAGVVAGGTPTQMLASWWATMKQTPAYVIFFRQVLYFAVPMGMLTLGAWMVWTRPAPNYMAHMEKADQLKRQGRADETLQEAELALADMERQLPIARKTAELQPTAAHESELAELIYIHSLAQEISIPALKGQPPNQARYAMHLGQIQEAMDTLEKALQIGGPLGYPGRENMTEADAKRSLQTWQHVADQCRARLGLASDR